MKRIAFIALFLLLMSPAAAHAQWVLQFGSGTGYSFPAHLTIKQTGQPDLNLTGEYETRAFETMAWYYDLRLAKWRDNKAWEFESLHHKVYLDNMPPEVQKFAISHGYNMNTINRAWRKNKFIYRLGAGVVMTHPETIVRNKRKEDEGGVNGFYISGLTARAGIERRFDINEKVFFYMEAQATLSYAKIPIAEGTATVPNRAVHGIMGFGYKMPTL